MKYIFVFRGHVLTESTGCVLILTFRSCFEFLQKVFLGLMYPFSCVLWAINSKQLLTIRRVPAPSNGCGPHAGKSGKEALTHESGIFCRHRKNGK